MLTAGHCNIPPLGDDVPPINVVALGVTSQDDLDVPGAETLTVSRRRTHPGFVDTREVHDITALLLAAPARTTPAAVATPAELSAARDVTLVGFGDSDPASSMGFGLQRQVSVPIDAIRRAVSDDLRSQEQTFGFESDLEFVAGGNGEDSCNGDSGGPAYILAGGNNRKVAGLASRSRANAQDACGDGGIYTRLDANWDFVREFANKFGVNLPAL